MSKFILAFCSNLIIYTKLLKLSRTWYNVSRKANLYKKIGDLYGIFS